MTVEATTTATGSDHRSLVWARMGSFLSLLPLGIWTVNHLWDQLAAYQGAAAWQEAVTHHPHPVAHFVTMVVVLAPLVIHSIWGVQRLFSFRPNNNRYGNFKNWRYLFQRLSAAGLLLFLGAHLWLAMIRPRFFNNAPEAFDDLARHMRFHPPTTIVYVLGILGVAYHLANGLNGFAWTWGMFVGRKAQKVVDLFAILLGVALLLMGWGAIALLWQAGQQLGRGDVVF